MSAAPRLRWGRVLAAAVSSLLIIGGAVVAAPAYAAGQGPGFGTWPSSIVGWEGGVVVPDGTIAYCFEPGHANPVGPTTDAGVVGELASSTPFGQKTVAGDALARINRVIGEFGQTADNVQASAVSFVVKHLANPEAMYRSSGWNGSHDLNGFIRWKLLRTVGGDTVAAIQARAHEILAATEGTTASSSGSGSITLSIDPADHSSGTATVRFSPGSATASIELTNGVFLDSGSPTIDGVRDGQVLRIRGAAPTGDGGPYRISAAGRVAMPAGYSADVHAWRTAGQQGVAGPGGRAGGDFTIRGEDSAERSVTFRPVVTTLTGEISADGRLRDTLTFATEPGADGLDNPWPTSSDGAALPVAFEVTAYGPFASAPELTDAAPPEAPVVASVRVVSGPGGPAETAVAEFSGLVAGGIYTFVARYDEGATPAPTRAYLPAGYAWQHAFGMVDETTIVPMRIDLSSQVDSSAVPLSGASRDTVFVENSGVWLERAGAPIEIVLRGEYVHVPDASGVGPSETLPEGARVVATRELRVTAPGAYDIEEPPTAVASGSGLMTWRWSIQRSDQPTETAEWVVEEFEKYFEPTQTQEIHVPEVATKAQAGSRPGETASDTAIVQGVLPENGALLAFEAYNVPAGTPNDQLVDVCTPENLVFSNRDDSGAITQAGEYTSPAIETPRYAKTLWVESLWSVPTAERPSEFIARGACGILNETTFTVAVTTQIKTPADAPTASVGAVIWDTSETRGWIPEGGRHFYHAYAWQGDAPVCDDTTLIGSVESTSGILTGGLHPDDDPLVETSETLTVPESARGGSISFVEQLVDSAGRTVSKGECGEKTETIRVAGEPLPATGGGDLPLWVPLVGGGVFVAGIALAAFAAARRRRDPASL